MSKKSKNEGVITLVDKKLRSKTKCGDDGNLLFVKIEEDHPVKLTVVIENTGKFCEVDVLGNPVADGPVTIQVHAFAPPDSSGSGTFTLKEPGSYRLIWQCHSIESEKKRCAARIRVYQHL